MFSRLEQYLKVTDIKHLKTA